MVAEHDGITVKFALEFAPAAAVRENSASLAEFRWTPTFSLGVSRAHCTKVQCFQSYLDEA